jgi:hypothetical protein
VYRGLLREGRFLALLLRIDEEKRDEVHGAGCPHCGGRLHTADFSRKPRGILCRDDLPEGYAKRFDLCCGRCRKRTLPPSVRFLERKVYLAVSIAIATVLLRGNDRDAMGSLRRELGVSRSTLERWRRWWDALTGSAFFRVIRGRLPPDLDETAMPTSLLERLSGSWAERMRELLLLLRPMQLRAFPGALRESR